MPTKKKLLIIIIIIIAPAAFRQQFNYAPTCKKTTQQIVKNTAHMERA